MSTAAHFNQFGQTLMPQFFGMIFPDTMTITAETITTGTGGGQIKGGTSNAYTSVPVKYQPLGASQRAAYADKLVSSAGYLLTMPTHTSAGARINLDLKTHTLVVVARGNEPAHTFRPIAVGNKQGVVFEVVCDKEN